MEKTVLQVDKLAGVLKLLGDKTRLTIIGMLSNRECCVCEFVEVFEMSQPSISQHLRKLRDGGLVKEKRKGQWIYYSLNAESEAYPLVEMLLTQIPDQQEKFERLEVEGKRVTCN